MGQGALEELNKLDRKLVVGRMAAELPKIRETLGLSVDQVADKVGMDRDQLYAVETRRRDLTWSEYLSLLFLFWRDDIGQEIVEAKGLFPGELREAFSIDRNIG